jgi:hypothetical protein
MKIVSQRVAEHRLYSMLGSVLIWILAVGLTVSVAFGMQGVLYRGAPYLQESFAYGIRVHVGPVLGWQPPRAQR